MTSDVFIVLGIIFISIVSRSIQVLNWSGMVTSIFVGLAIWVGVGWKGLILLGLFFSPPPFGQNGEKIENKWIYRSSIRKKGEMGRRCLQTVL